MRALEDCPGAYREIFKALVTAVVSYYLARYLARSDAITKAANRAVRTLGPEAGLTKGRRDTTR